jgi:hypothetical protein
MFEDTKALTEAYTSIKEEEQPKWDGKTGLPLNKAAQAQWEKMPEEERKQREADADKYYSNMLNSASQQQNLQPGPQPAPRPEQPGIQAPPQSQQGGPQPAPRPEQPPQQQPSQEPKPQQIHAQMTELGHQLSQFQQRYNQIMKSLEANKQ